MKPGIEDKKTFIYNFINDNNPSKPSAAKEFIVRIENDPEEIEKFYSTCFSKDRENRINVQKNLPELSQKMLSFSAGKLQNAINSMYQFGRIVKARLYIKYLFWTIFILLFWGIPINNAIENRRLFSLQNQDWKTYSLLILSMLICCLIYFLKLRINVYRKNATNNSYLKINEKDDLQKFTFD